MANPEGAGVTPGRAAASGPRRLLARLRDVMAHESTPLPAIVRLVAAEMVADVCSLYVMKPGDLLELAATEGLRPEAVGHTRFRVGEGIVGLTAATGHPQNLPDAQLHPAFAYRGELGEEPFVSMLTVPVRRAGRTHGVLVTQNRTSRRYEADEVEVMETVAMLLAELLASAGAADGAAEGILSTVPRRFSASAIVSGIVIGTVVLRTPGRTPRGILADDPDREQARLEAAVKRMQHGIDALIRNGLPDGDAPREILEAYRLVAADSGLMRRISEAIRGGLSAEAAVLRVSGDLRDRMRRIADPYLRERLADLEDLGTRLMTALAGGEADPVNAEGAILVARRLGPAELLEWHARGIVGAVIEEASAGSHASILARALDLPVMGGARGVLDTAETGDPVILDGEDGQVILRPEQDVVQVYRHAIATRSAREASYAALRDQPATTRDGTRVTLMLNVGLALELAHLDITGAEGIGLFRTEIAMLARGAIADMADQAAVYGRVIDAAAGRPVVFRTLDLGGDKLLPGVTQSEEDNPAMGWRSLRVGLDRPALLRRQLRALLLAANGRPLSVMFPMVATVAEFRAARSLLLAEAARVRPPPSRLEIGTMLEVPALLWQLDELLADADFVSVGTNDLLQFLFAADRGTPSLANRYDILSPPVLDLLDELRAETTRAGVALSICGEAASRPLEALVFAALGVGTLSMPAAGILPVKAALAAVDLRAFGGMLSRARQTAHGAPSLREPLAAWAREHDVPI